MKNRLQIKYYMPNNFPYTREEAKEYIEKLFATNNENAKFSLPAEPIAVFYGDSLSDANVILAIGRGGDGKRLVANIPYFLIDTAKINEDAAATAGVLDEVKTIAEQAKADIAKLQTEMTNAANEIVAIWKRIGDKSDGVTLDTVYGYINMNIQKIMGGEVVEGLGSVNAIANAIKRLRLRVSAVETNVTDINTRMNTVEASLKEIDADYDSFTQEMNNKIDGEIENRIQEHIAIRGEFAAADATTLKSAKDYTDARELEINKKINTDVATEKSERTAEDNLIRKDFATADATTLINAKSYTDARELEITSAYQAYANTAKSTAVNEAKSYTDARELAITEAYKEYVNTVNTSAKEELVGEIQKVAVKSTNNSIVVSQSVENGTDIKVNIDGNTIVQDEQTGFLKVASDKLVQYNGNGAIKVSDAENGNKTIELKINDADKVISNDVNGLYTTLSLKWVKNVDGNAKDEIQLIGKENTVISRIDVAEFLKDGMLENVTLNTEDVENPKLVFVFNSISGKQTIEVPVKELLYVYSAGNGLTLTDSVFDIKIADDSEVYLTVSSNGLKLNGINQLVADTKQEINDSVNELKNRVSSNEASISNLSVLTTEINSNLVAEVKAREDADKKLQESIIETKQAITDAKLALTDAYTKADEALKTELSQKITANAQNIDKLNGVIAVEGSVRNMIYESVVGDVINNISPEDAKNQTLIKKINIEGLPYFYASNNTADMMHETRVLSEIIAEIIASNEALKAENEELKLNNVVLATNIEALVTRLDAVEEEMKNMIVEIDMDAIKTEVVPVAVAQAKSEIISSNVFKGTHEELGVDVVEGESVTYKFADDAVFMADYNELFEEE